MVHAGLRVLVFNKLRIKITQIFISTIKFKFTFFKNASKKFSYPVLNNETTFFFFYDNDIDSSINNFQTICPLLINSLLSDVSLVSLLKSGRNEYRKNIRHLVYYIL